MKIMDELLDEFLKTWKKENNTEEAVYSAYHYDAMIAFAKYYHQSKVNNGVLDDVISCKNLDDDFSEALNDFADKTRKTKPNKKF